MLKNHADKLNLISQNLFRDFSNEAQNLSKRTKRIKPKAIKAEFTDRLYSKSKKVRDEMLRRLNRPSASAQRLRVSQKWGAKASKGKRSNVPAQKMGEASKGRCQNASTQKICPLKRYLSAQKRQNTKAPSAQSLVA
ncbi:hypothetical protein BKN38_09475 [Helicobacter sp. CLO-3]|nr:hypothetical protein BA723_07975 [Helicobacter sp. CLO-3]OHU81235.1 hypothetical protein BKN38_09475 [Helicobacter sp. CLO-3]